MSPYTISDIGDDVSENSDKATLESMQGIFYFLGMGAILAMSTILWECCVASYKDVQIIRKQNKVSIIISNTKLGKYQHQNKPVLVLN